MYVNLEDVRAQLVGAGLVLDKELTFDSRIQRWKIDGENNEKRGWSRLREWVSKAGNRYIVGAYGIWLGTDDGYTKIELPKRDEPTRPTLSDEDIAAMRAAQKAAAQKLAEERRAEGKTAAQWAAQVWAHCLPAPADHEYLVRKQIQAHGARLMVEPKGLTLPGIDDSNWWRLTQAPGALVVPMHDANANVVGIQFVYPKDHPRAAKAGKEFWPSGMAMGGSFGVIGPVRRDGLLLVTEGFATAASLAEATGQSIAYAFSANNLGKAGKLLRKTYKSLRLLFCADDDYLTEAKGQGNPGIDAALIAASEIERAAWVKPDFAGPDGQDLRAGRKLTDFNDLAVLTGVPLTLANQINTKLDALKWRDAAALRGSSAQQGGGESEVGDDGRRIAASVLTLDELVDRFVYIDDDTGEFVFDQWTRAVCRRSKMLSMLPAGVRPDDIKRHPMWVSRAVYIDQVGFDPGEDDPNIKCNRWTGWPTRPAAGKCEVMLDLLRYLCSGEENNAELFQWVINWLAYPLQHPGAKMHSAIVVHGPQGTGKSRFFEAYAKIFGEYSIILNQGAIEDKFNADWSERKLFVLADEVVANTEKFHLKNQLKNFITSEWVRINPKNVAAHRERNHMNMVFLSNEIQPVVLENDDRRHCVIYTPKKLGDEFYADLTDEIAAGGIAALHQYLLDIKLGDFKPWTRPPMTDAKRRLILVGAGSEEQFITDWRDGHLDVPFGPVGKATLYAEYQSYARREGEPRPRPAKYFWAHVERMGWYVGVTDRLDSLNSATKVSWRCCIPPDDALNLAAKRLGPDGDPRKEDGESQAAWLCRMHWRVDHALRNRDPETRNVA